MPAIIHSPARVGTRSAAEFILREMLGPGAVFRVGQWEAIHKLLAECARLLLVQRTGWGKSIVYFIATKLRREQGSGPALLISPLLSLMRNQLQMAERAGIRAATINSANSDEWDSVEAALAKDCVDVLLISPERLGNQRFHNSTLRSIVRGIGMFVVDEAHCISDWGHDFRPDYRRIVRIVQALPRHIPVLATTATANDRVIDDVQKQLGGTITVMRGGLARSSLRLQAIQLGGQAERLAWLAQHIPAMPGSGIVYCLTVADAQRVAAWLHARGIRAFSYHAELRDFERVSLEQRLLDNELKVLAATVALGMGFDKPDLGFVVHFQRPGSVVAYYQQVGRAGRAMDRAFAVLLNGGEDDRIQEYFFNSAFPGADECDGVLNFLAHSRGLTRQELLAKVNIPYGRLERILKLLEVEGAIERDGYKFHRTLTPWHADFDRWQKITEQRKLELARMQEFVSTRECLMQFVQRELDDPTAAPCSSCANCCGSLFPGTLDRSLVSQARAFLKQQVPVLEPRRKWPMLASEPFKGMIPVELQNAEGRALSHYGDAGWGESVAAGKYRDGRFSDDLIEAAAELIAQTWRPSPFPAWVTAVPSLRRPLLVADLARRLAARLGLPFLPVIQRVRSAAEQKEMQNSAHQLRNLQNSLRVTAGDIPSGSVLLVDDMVDSRWTMTMCGYLLRQAGSGKVFPFALATTTSGGDSA